MSSKGVSPVVATLLLILIAVVSSMVLMGIVNSSNLTLSTNQQVDKDLEYLKAVQVRAPVDENFHIYILNKGSINTTVEKLYIKDGFGAIISVMPVNIAIGVNQIVDVLVDGIQRTPWDWYEVTYVTKRGNNFNVELYDKMGGFMVTKPKNNETEYGYNVTQITANTNLINDQTNLSKFYFIDESTYNIPSRTINTGYVSHSPMYWDFDTDSGWYVGPKDQSGALDTEEGTPGTIHLIEKNNFISGIFFGQIGNLNADTLNLTFTFYIQPARLNSMRGTVQFYDWNNGYVQVGNGYAEFDKTNGTDTGGNFMRYSLIVNKEGFLDGTGCWSVMINITCDNDNLDNKFDYVALYESQANVNSIETVLYFDVSSSVTDPEKITSLVFSTTGYFPSEVNYWVDVYNNDLGMWENFDMVPGSNHKQTSIVQITDNCDQYISSSKMIVIRYIPMYDLPSGTVVDVDQSRLLIRVMN